jgi:hypothetical protein
MFKVNFTDFVRKLIPYFLRKEKNLAFVNSFIKPIQEVNDDLNVFRDDIAFKMAFNSQIIYLEQFLNTVYPNGLIYPNNIHIVDGANVEYVYLYNYAEGQKENYLYNDSEAGTRTYLNNYLELADAGISYFVRIPNSVKNGVDWKGNPFDENVLKSQLNYYNTAGKTYKIQYF